VVVISIDVGEGDRERGERRERERRGRRGRRGLERWQPFILVKLNMLM
jgi:hypothetical protein